MDVKLVGITGKAGAGKDTLASFLLEAHMDESRIGKQIAFADPVKKATAEMYGIPLNNLYDRELKETVDEFWGISPRQMAQLQQLAQEPAVEEQELLLPTVLKHP